MIKIVVDTEDELTHVRRVLRTEACSHRTCPNFGKRCTLCAECVEEYCTNKVELYKTEKVEIPERFAV